MTKRRELQKVSTGSGCLWLAVSQRTRSKPTWICRAVMRLGEGFHVSKHIQSFGIQRGGLGHRDSDASRQTWENED